MINIVSLSLLFTSVWTVLFFIISRTFTVKIPKEDLWELRSNIVGLMHFLFAFSLFLLNNREGYLLSASNSKIQENLLCVILGYYIHSTLCGIYFKYITKSLVFHNFLVILGICFGVWVKEGYMYMFYFYFFAEITTPLSVIRNTLGLIGQQITKSYVVMDSAFILWYFVWKVVVTGAMLYTMVGKVGLNLGVKVLGGGTQGFSIYIAYKYIQNLKGYYRKYLKNKEKWDLLPWFKSYLRID